MKAAKKTKLHTMRKKSHVLCIKYGDEFVEVIEFLKHREGGITRFIEEALSKVKITENERNALELFKKFGLSKKR